MNRAEALGVDGGAGIKSGRMEPFLGVPSGGSASL